MHLKITSLEGLVRNEDVKQVTVDTLMGQITILPGHDSMVGVLKPGLIKLTPVDQNADRAFEFIQNDDVIVFGMMGGVLKCENNQIQILTNMVITNASSGTQALEESKRTLKAQIEKLRQMHTSTEELEQQISQMEVEMKVAFWKEK